MAARITDRIATLEDRLKQLKVQKQRVEARRRTLDARRSRRDDTRRKILVGAVVLEKVSQGEFQTTLLNGWLDASLTRPEDRALFELPPSASAPTQR